MACSVTSPTQGVIAREIGPKLSSLIAMKNELKTVVVLDSTLDNGRELWDTMTKLKATFKTVSQEIRNSFALLQYEKKLNQTEVQKARNAVDREINPLSVKLSDRSRDLKFRLDVLSKLPNQALSQKLVNFSQSLKDILLLNAKADLRLLLQMVNEEIYNLGRLKITALTEFYDLTKCLSDVHIEILKNTLDECRLTNDWDAIISQFTNLRDEISKALN